MTRTLNELARREPDRVGWAWLDVPEEGDWTYGVAASRVGGVARELTRRGLAAGDRLAVVGGNHPEWVLLKEAAIQAGLTFVPVGSRLAPPERDWILANAEPRLVLGDPALAPGAIAMEDWSWTRCVERAPLADVPVPSSAAQLLYTSGSSGRPKGVLRPRAGDQARVEQSIATYGLRASDVHLVAGPLYHSGPSIFSTIHRALGARQLVLAHFDGERVARLAASGEISTLFLVPTQWRMLLEAIRGGAPRPRLRVAWTAGSAIDVDTRLELVELLGEGVLWEFYGTTETGTVTTLPPAKQRSHAATVGFPEPNVTLAILDGNGSEPPLGTAGRVYVRSPTLMLDYHRGPGSEDEAPALRHGDYLSVGDWGYLAADGALTLIGREGGMIITGGMNVYPEEVEGALRTLPQVREAVVFGLVDRKWGAAIAAVVEPVAGATLDAGELGAALRARIAGFKVPKHWAIGAIPRTPSEKVIRDPAVLLALFGGVA
ncbi:MAG: AMP-binding protein [bacterium]